MPEAPRQVVKFFNFMKTHITLESNGMGVELRESRAEILNLAENEGYDYLIYQNMIEEFEIKLLNMHYENTKKEE